MITTPRHALVTGAGSGIGRAVATALVREGWTVGLVDVEKTAIYTLARQLGVQAWAMVADVSDHASVQQAFAVYAQHHDGRLDLLVNSAGLLYMGHFEDQAPPHLARLLAVNNLGMAHCCYAALPLLQRSAKQGLRPAVVNLSSASAITGIPSMAVYSASKFWVSGFTEALASEWARHGIAVHDVMPPFVNTPMLAGGAQNPFIQRLGVDLEPQEVARQILRAATGGPLHRPISWRLKALLALKGVLPARLLRRVVARLGGYPAFNAGGPSARR